MDGAQPPPQGSAQDSGVETECDQESNDSSLSSVSLGGGNPGGGGGAGINFHNHAAFAGAAVAGPVFAAPPAAPVVVHDHAGGEFVPLPPEPDEDEPEPVAGPSSQQMQPSSVAFDASSMQEHRQQPSIADEETNGSETAMDDCNSSNPTSPLPLTVSEAPVSRLANTSSVSISACASLMPPPSVTEDGYLGDCSSDGGNEKNFPMPPEKLKKLLFQRNHASANGGDLSDPPPPSDFVDPPAGLAFQNLQANSSIEFGSGYSVSPTGSGSLCSRASAASQSSSRKMRSSFVRNKYSANGNNWSQLKATIASRKLRLAANVNNVETMERLLDNGVNVNGTDDHLRTALHMGAAKGYTDVVRLLLQHGADPNQKDTLGNTALHLAACTNHIGVVTLLLRAGTNLAELDNNGRTPMQLAQSKLKLLQRSDNGIKEMGKIKTEVNQVVEMMREYLSKKCQGTTSAYSDLLDSFSQRLTLHQTHDDISSDLQVLLDSLGSLQVK